MATWSVCAGGKFISEFVGVERTGTEGATRFNVEFADDGTEDVRYGKRREEEGRVWEKTSGGRVGWVVCARDVGGVYTTAVGFCESM